MPPLPNPRETIIRNVLLFPAEGTEPYIIPKTFSEIGAKAYREEMYTRSVDLRSHYGTHMDTTHCQFLTCDEGQFMAYSNISPGLPVNQSVARIVEIDPSTLESKVFWRGDIIVVKSEDWPGPLVRGGGNHKIYHNVDLTILKTAEQLLKEMYKKNMLGEWIKQKVEEIQKSVQNDRFVRQTFQMAHMPISTMKPLDLNQLKKDIQLWKKISRYYAEIETISNKVCALCASPGSPDLKVCAGCRRIPYCSKECQKEDWKYHKVECKSQKTAEGF